MSDSNYHHGEKNESCYFCLSLGTEEHHIIPQRFGGPDERDNIVEVCESCHKKLERLYDKSFYEWFGIEDEKGERKFHRACAYRYCDNHATREINEIGVFCDDCAYDRAEAKTEDLSDLRTIELEPYEVRVQENLEELTSEKSPDAEPYYVGGGSDE